MGTLYLIATPIGNLGDITARAVRILSEVPLIAAEDTRRTRKLLNHLDIQTPITSYYEHNKLKKLDIILETLENSDVALVSDAGTPALNDPGFLLVQAAIEAGFRVSPVPGPSAPLAALVVSGIPANRFTYLGYLPRKETERKIYLREVKGLPYTLIFLETTHRLIAALQDIYAVLGDRQLAVARELTKLHEEIFRGTVLEAIDRFQKDSPRGEITLVITGATADRTVWTSKQVDEAILERLALDETPSQIARDLVTNSGWPRRKLYQRITEVKKRSDPGSRD